MNSPRQEGASVEVPIRLIATDIDGTLRSRNEADFEHYLPFAHLLSEMKEMEGTQWAVCTGRGFNSTKRALKAFRALGATPDFILWRHAYVARPSFPWALPFLSWNWRIACSIVWSALQTQGAFARWRRWVLVNCRGSGVVLHEERSDFKRLWFRFPTEQEAQTAEDYLSERVAEYPLLTLFRFRKEVDVRTVPFSKGVSLQYLIRRLGIGPEHVLAIGDGHNDLSMFKPTVAERIGCPANSENEVLKAVSDARGHVALARTLEGVLEVVRAFRTGQVNSDLPATWKPSVDENNPSFICRRKPHGRKRKSHMMHDLLLAGVAGYVILMALAVYGMIPMLPVFSYPYKMLTRFGSWLGALF